MKEIILTQGYKALIDDEDFEVINKFKWSYLESQSGNQYAHCHSLGDKNRKTIRMHRLIMKAPKGKEVDHINGDGLDNRKLNLRICNRNENQKNQKNTIFLKRRKNVTSKFKGVCWHKKSNQWTSQAGLNKKRIYLGIFRNEINAAKAYDEFAKKNFGKFARLNFV